LNALLVEVLGREMIHKAMFVCLFASQCCCCWVGCCCCLMLLLLLVLLFDVAAVTWVFSERSRAARFEQRETSENDSETKATKSGQRRCLCRCLCLGRRCCRSRRRRRQSFYSTPAATTRQQQHQLKNTPSKTKKRKEQAA